jgi:hypothetical protein
MIAKYQDGYQGMRKSEHYFRQGVKSVFPSLSNADADLAEHVLAHLWEGVRCGIYHQGLTAGRIRLSGDYKVPLALAGKERVLQINPRLLIETLEDHFTRYVCTLLDPSKSEEREKFVTRFDKMG